MDIANVLIRYCLAVHQNQKHFPTPKTTQLGQSAVQKRARFYLKKLAYHLPKGGLVVNQKPNQDFGVNRIHNLLPRCFMAVSIFFFSN